MDHNGRLSSTEPLIGGPASLFSAGVRLYMAGVAGCARALGNMGIHPNVLTVSSLAPALAAGILVGIGQFTVAAVFLLLSGILDILDGAVARETGKTTQFGALLDSSLDRLSDFAVPAGLAVFYAPHGAILLIPVLMGASGFLISYIRARTEGLGMSLPRLWMRREERVVLTLLALALAPLTVPGMAIAAPVTLLVCGLVGVLSVLAAGTMLIAAARQ